MSCIWIENSLKGIDVKYICDLIDCFMQFQWNFIFQFVVTFAEEGFASHVELAFLLLGIWTIIKDCQLYIWFIFQ